MKKLISIGLLSTLVLGQTSAFATHNTPVFSQTDLDQDETAAVELLRTSVLDLVKFAAFFEGSEGDQILSLVDALVEAIKARNGDEVFKKGRELLQLINQISQNDEVNVQEGLDHIARLVDAIRKGDSRSATAAITDLAIFIARIVKNMKNS